MEKNLTGAEKHFYDTARELCEFHDTLSMGALTLIAAARCNLFGGAVVSEEDARRVDLVVELLADGKARVERVHLPKVRAQQWMLVVFPDRDFVFHYGDEKGGEPIGRGYMLCAVRRVENESLANEGAARRVFECLARDTAYILAELPRLEVGLLREKDIHPTPPAQEAEEPAGTSAPAPRS